MLFLFKSVDIRFLNQKIYNLGLEYIPKNSVDICTKNTLETSDGKLLFSNGNKTPLYFSCFKRGQEWMIKYQQKKQKSRIIYFLVFSIHFISFYLSILILATEGWDYPVHIKLIGEISPPQSLK